MTETKYITEIHTGGTQVLVEIYDKDGTLIALRAAETIYNHNMSSSQISEEGEWVDALGWQDEGEGVMSWHGYLAPDCKPTALVVGS